MVTRDAHTSIIISVHNGEETIRATLGSVFASSLRAYEVVVVDDASTDNTAGVCRTFPLKVVRLKENHGPAIGRNVGVSQAKGTILFFLDSDVTFAPDLLKRMLHHMLDDPELSGVGTLSSPIPLNPCFFSRYFALQEYLMMDRLLGDAGRAKLSYICTRCGCIRRQVFDQIGGFNEVYREPSIEDYELSMRMAGTYRVLYDKSLLNHHHFPDTAWKILSRYHRNTREMFLLKSRMKVKRMAPFENDAAGRLCVGFSGVFFLAGWLDPRFLMVSAAAFLMAVVMRRKLLGLFCREEGWMFLLKGWLFYSVSTISVATGLVSGVLTFLWRRCGGRFQERLWRET